MFLELFTRGWKESSFGSRVRLMPYQPKSLTGCEPQVGYRGSHTRAGPGYWSAGRANRFDCKPQSFVEW
ncbi:hypothetical protein AV530_016499 [Patagioenas fasciata monilis]|uniref:Uncharacterized protein n=1 Tax=Patagioenas fasciata monilis TaxID=372326 RepID=A0A1V4J2B9_PATFA|nr:hypothetical protein AV530_016499 [Patagioenas fasciata monilis]